MALPMAPPHDQGERDCEKNRCGVAQHPDPAASKPLPARIPRDQASQFGLLCKKPRSRSTRFHT